MFPREFRQPALWGSPEPRELKGHSLLLGTSPPSFSSASARSLPPGPASHNRPGVLTIKYRGLLPSGDTDRRKDTCQEGARVLPGAKAFLAPSGRNAHSYWKDTSCGKRDRGLSQLCTTLPHSAGCSWAAVLAFPELSTAPRTKGYCGGAPVSAKRGRDYRNCAHHY